MSAEHFNPHSKDAMFATVLARLDEDARSREAFRREVRERFDRGTARMDDMDTTLQDIRTQTTKTNGRVTRLENQTKILTAKALAAVAGVALAWKAFGWLHAHGISPF